MRGMLRHSSMPSITVSTLNFHTMPSAPLCQSFVRLRSVLYVAAEPAVSRPRWRSIGAMWTHGVRGCCQAYSKRFASVLLGKPDTTATYLQGRCFCVGLAPPVRAPLCCLIRVSLSSVYPTYPRMGEGSL
jgi:hypothetical protein